MEYFIGNTVKGIYILGGVAEVERAAGSGILWHSN